MIEQSVRDLTVAFTQVLDAAQDAEVAWRPTPGARSSPASPSTTAVPKSLRSPWLIRLPFTVAS
jgi:hypothetical protein